MIFGMSIPAYMLPISNLTEYFVAFHNLRNELFYSRPIGLPLYLNQCIKILWEKKSTFKRSVGIYCICLNWKDVASIQKLYQNKMYHSAYIQLLSISKLNSNWADLISVLFLYLFVSFYLSIYFNLSYIFQICSGITRGRVLNGELYARTLQKLIYLHLPTACFIDFSSIYGSVDWKEIFIKQCRQMQIN